MAKQLLIYSQVQPVSSQRHRDWAIKQVTDFEFARDVNSVPLMAVEFPNAASEMAVVFTGNDDQIMPVVILGVREQENLYLNDEGQMTSRYVPAFLRRYPFVFSSSDDGANFTLCIDETYTGCNQEGVGERLFDAEGEKTQYLDNVLAFLKEYQVHFNRTRNFCSKLKELDLLEPMGAQFTQPDGEKLTLTGFMAVNREKLKSLTGEQLADLAKTDALELIYIHLQSMRNFTSMLEKVAGAEASEPAASKEEAAAPEEEVTLQ
ncbi:SapC family protein [Kistimonas asteriae]|uniref:SapC family protein n=1 Tax=Kistimonas asteriae TaxID=517724 RepID=UPI001BAC7395|nr:SapC family protein [Kistimonas asteriae]